MDERGIDLSANLSFQGSASCASFSFNSTTNQDKNHAIFGVDGIKNQTILIDQQQIVLPLIVGDSEDFCWNCFSRFNSSRVDPIVEIEIDWLVDKTLCSSSQNGNITGEYIIDFEEQSPSFGPFETLEIQFEFYQSIRLSGLTGLPSLTSAIPFAPYNLIYTLSGAQSWINIAADTSSNEAILTFIEPECGEFSLKITATYYDYQSES